MFSEVQNQNPTKPLNLDTHWGRLETVLGWVESGASAITRAHLWAGLRRLPCYVVPRASGCSIDSLIKPKTAKQKARAFLRWRKRR
jgi:hypothetical protein